MQIAREGKRGSVATTCLLLVLACALAMWAHVPLTVALAEDDTFVEQPKSTFFTTQGQGEKTAELSATVNMEGLDGIKLTYQWYCSPVMATENGTAVQDASGTVAEDGVIVVTLDSAFADKNGGVGWYYVEVTASAGTASYTFTSNAVACATSVGALSSLALSMLEDAYEDRMTDMSKYNATNWKKIETVYNEATSAIVAAAAASKPDADEIVKTMSGAIEEMAAVEQGGFDDVNDDDGKGNQSISGDGSDSTDGLNTLPSKSKSKSSKKKSSSSKTSSSSNSSTGSSLSSNGSALSSSSGSLSPSSSSSSGALPSLKRSTQDKDKKDDDGNGFAAAGMSGSDSNDNGANSQGSQGAQADASSGLQGQDSGTWFSEHAVPLSLVVLAVIAAICAAVWRISRSRNAAAITAEDEAFAGDDANVAAAVFDGIAMRAPISDAPVIEF